MPVGKIHIWRHSFRPPVSHVIIVSTLRRVEVSAKNFTEQIKAKVYGWHYNVAFDGFTAILILMQHKIGMGHLDVTTVSTCSRRCLEETLDPPAQTRNGKFSKIFKPLCLQPPQYPQSWNVINP
jgi:hypothetical protein